MPPPTTTLKPNGYRRLAKEELEAVRAMDSAIKANFNNVASLNLWPQFPIGALLAGTPDESAWRISDLCWGIVYECKQRSRARILIHFYRA